MKLPRAIADHPGKHQAQNGINNCEHQLQANQKAQVFVQKLRMACNCPVVKAGNPQVEKNIEHQRKVEQGKIHPVLPGTKHILHGTVDSQHPKWLNQEIQQKQQQQIGKKLPFQRLFVLQIIG
jgi:hypothetical protein